MTKADLHGTLGPQEHIRVDLQLVADQIKPGSRVLDVGCGDGMLLAYLRDVKQVDGRGLELSMARVSAAVGAGLAVIHGDLEMDLQHYPANAFDYVILSQTLQATHNPRKVLEDLLRVGRHAVVSFPNFGHWSVRLALLLSGRMPSTPTLPDQWYDTANIHLCTVKDFVSLVNDLGVIIEAGFALNGKGQRRSYNATGRVANLFSEQALFVLGREQS